MNILIYSAVALVAGLIAADVLRDRARQRREDRKRREDQEWAKIRSFLEESW